MRFQLLGPVRGWIGEQPINLGVRKQRFVLAVLALEPNTLVPTSRLVDLMWPDDPPTSARGMIHTYVSGLRSVLSRTSSAEVSLLRHPAGYELRCDPARVDAHCFLDLTVQARSSDDHAQRVVWLDEALGLWQGPALTGVAVEDIRVRLCHHLDQARLIAAEDRADALLQLGRPHGLIDQLSLLSVEHPTRQRLTWQLMLALHGTGRTADALRVYEQGRRYLADELGIDPTAELQELHRTLLRGGPDPTTDQGQESIAVLMRAPHATGRTSEALDRYTTTRRQLVEELGTDPRIELQQVHRAILRGEVEQPSPPASTPEPAPPHTIPAQLPLDVFGFVGRGAELAELDTTLAVSDRQPTAVVISALSGSAGVGKTALAVHWAHKVADRFPDGQLYVNLRGFDPAGSVMDPGEAIRRFLDALGVPPERVPPDLDAQAALYRTQLAGRRMLIVLDNARDSGQVRPLLPGASTCLVLVTSRNQLSGLGAADGARPITLDLLTKGKARQLLTHRLGADRVAAEPDAVEQIISACARLPLALAIVAARAATEAHLPLHTLAAGLRDNSSGSGARLDTLTTDDPATDVRAVFSWSYQTLTPDAARLFRLLGLHPGPDTSSPAAASLTAVPLPQVRSLLGELTRANLLIEHVPGRYTFHDLLRAYAIDLAHRLDPGQHCHTATHRILDHYLHTAHTAALLLYPARDPITITPPQPGSIPEHPTDHQQALDWFTAEHPVLLAAVDHAAATGLDTHTWQLAWTLDTFLGRRGHWHDQVAAWQAAVAAAGRLADPTAQASAHRYLALAFIQQGRLDDAGTQLRHALDLHVQAGDLAGQAHTHHRLGEVWEQQGRLTEALHHDQQALDLFRAAGHRRGQAIALNAVGWCHVLLGDHQQALAHCQQALPLFQEFADRQGQAATWDSLGYAHHHLGHHTQATTCYQHALDLCRDLGDRYGEATIHTHLGDTHHATGNPQIARDAWQHALTILDQLDHPGAQALRVKLRHPDQTPPEDEQDDRQS